MDIKGFFWLVITWLGLWGIDFGFKLGVGALGLLFLLGLAILLRFLGGKWLTIFMPERRIRCWTLGMLAGFASSLVFRVLGFGPEVLGINIIGATLGACLAILGWGLYPYLVILIKKPLR